MALHCGDSAALGYACNNQHSWLLHSRQLTAILAIRHVMRLQPEPVVSAVETARWPASGIASTQAAAVFRRLDARSVLKRTAVPVER